MPTPSQELQQIVSRLHADVTLQEMDKHVSALTRDLARYKNAVQELLNHVSVQGVELDELRQKAAQLGEKPPPGAVAEHPPE